jgi:uncharacterized phage protein (TIGR02216 family)
LRLSPHEFWALSLKEWCALVEGRLGSSAPALARAEFDALMKVYPADK